MKRNANIADFFKPFQRPEQPRLNLTERPSDSTTSSAPSSRVSHLPTPNPTPAVDTPSKPHLPSSDPAPASRSSSPSLQQSSVLATSVASLPSSRLTLLNQPLDPHPSVQSHAEANSSLPEMAPSSLSSSSLPPLSQTSNTSSRRVFKDGVEMVRTSDSEEDSDSSLEDLSVLLAARKRSAPVESSPPRSSSSPRDTRKKDYNFRSQAKRPKKPEKILPTPTKYKISLAALAKQASKERAAEAKSREAEEAADKLEELLKDDVFDEITGDNLLEAVGDVERAKEAREALERTGALETFQVWRFFGSCRSTKRSRPFPTATLPSHGWQTLLNDTAARENALQSGLVQIGIARSALPDEIISWMFDEVCFGTRAELKTAYLRILGASTPQVRSLLDKERIQQLFSRMGASVETRGDGASLPNIVPTEVVENEPRPAPPAGLAWLLQLLRQSASQLSPEAVEYGLEVLLRVNVDDCVLVDGELQILSREAVSTFLAMLRTSFHDIARRTYTSLHDYPVLQVHLISSLPAHTPLECSFRRRLALCFLLQNSTASLTTPLTSRTFLESTFAAIIHTNPNFRMNASTNFANVAAAANILDAAFETGFSDFAFVKELASNPRKLTFRDAEAKARRQAALLAEEEFNAGVDKLVELLHSVNGQMRSGIKNLIQSEAKVALDRVEHRIGYGVRTQELSKRDIFGEMGYGAQTLMESWVKTEKVDDEKDQDKELAGKKVWFVDGDTDKKPTDNSGEATPDGEDAAARGHASSELKQEDGEKKPTQNGSAPATKQEGQNGAGG